jgi:hypothetical protein
MRAMFGSRISKNLKVKRNALQNAMRLAHQPAKRWGNDAPNLSQRFDTGIFFKNTMISHRRTRSPFPLTFLSPFGSAFPLPFPSPGDMN